MSGNKYDDILEHVATSDIVQAKKIARLMSSFRPKVHIDRVFQKQLKKQLLLNKKTEKTWSIYFPQLSLVITSFFVLVGVWKITGGIFFIEQQTLRKGGEIASIESSPPSAEMALFQTEASNPGYNTTVPMEDTFDRDTSENLGMSQVATMTAYKTSDEKPVTPLSKEANEINLNEEIASISSDIDAIALSSTPLDPPLAKTSPAGLRTKDTTQVAHLPIQYPARMAIYRKDTAWSTSEIQIRSGTGITKTLENALRKDELEARIDISLGWIDFSLEYRLAKKQGENGIYLIPCIRSADTFGTVLYTPMIAGYTLD